MRPVSGKQAREHSSDLLGGVHIDNQPAIIERKGKPFAVVVRPDQFERKQTEAKATIAQVIDELQSANDDADPDEVLRVVTKQGEAIRQERMVRGAYAKRWRDRS